MAKHGEAAFTTTLLEDSGTSFDNDRERHWIAELQPEYNMTEGGDGGWINDQTGNTWTVSEQGRENMRRARLDNPERYSNQWDQFRDNITGRNNHQCLYTYHTPWGSFDTLQAALTEAQRLRKQGRKDVLVSRPQLKKYCESDIIIPKDGRRTFPLWRGKSSKQLGFYRSKYEDG